MSVCPIDEIPTAWNSIVSIDFDDIHSNYKMYFYFTNLNQKSTEKNK